LTHIASDLDSLGWVHADDRRGELIDLIEARKADGLITLWLDDGLSEPVPMPRNYRLEWVGGTAQGPGYECEVTAALPPLHAQNDHLFPRAVFDGKTCSAAHGRSRTSNRVSSFTTRD
jgi:hypothetical protein